MKKIEQIHYYLQYIFNKKIAVKTIPHIIANETPSQQMVSLSMSQTYLGFDTAMVLRGDFLNNKMSYTNKYLHAFEVVQHIQHFNNSRNL